MSLNRPHFPLLTLRDCPLGLPLCEHPTIPRKKVSLFPVLPQSRSLRRPLLFNFIRQFMYARPGYPNHAFSTSVR
jgi:hypothetical protein